MSFHSTKYFLPQSHQQPLPFWDPPSCRALCWLLAGAHGSLSGMARPLRAGVCEHPQVPHIPVWLPGTLWDPSGNTGLHLADTFYWLDCNDRGNVGVVRGSGPEGPGPIAGGAGVHSWKGVRFHSLIHGGSSQQGGWSLVSVVGSVGNLNTGGSAVP